MTEVMTQVRVWDDGSQSWESGWLLVSTDEEAGTAVVKEEHEVLPETRTVDWDDFTTIERTD